MVIDASLPRYIQRMCQEVESWLAEDGPDSARLSIGERSYTMVGPPALSPSNGRAA